MLPSARLTLLEGVLLTLTDGKGGAGNAVATARALLDGDGKVKLDGRRVSSREVRETRDRVSAAVVELRGELGEADTSTDHPEICKLPHAKMAKRGKRICPGCKKPLKMEEGLEEGLLGRGQQGGTHGKVELKRMGNGKFAPKGLGQVLTAGQHVTVPRADGATPGVGRVVSVAGDRADVKMVTGPDKGTSVVSHPGMSRKDRARKIMQIAPPQTPGISAPLPAEVRIEDKLRALEKGKSMSFRSAEGPVTVTRHPHAHKYTVAGGGHNIDPDLRRGTREHVGSADAAQEIASRLRASHAADAHHTASHAASAVEGDGIEIKAKTGHVAKVKKVGGKYHVVLPGAPASPGTTGDAAAERALGSHKSAAVAVAKAKRELRKAGAKFLEEGGKADPLAKEGAVKRKAKEEKGKFANAQEELKQRWEQLNADGAVGDLLPEKALELMLHTGMTGNLGGQVAGTEAGPQGGFGHHAAENALAALPHAAQLLHSVLPHLNVLLHMIQAKAVEEDEKLALAEAAGDKNDIAWARARAGWAKERLRVAHETLGVLRDEDHGGLAEAAAARPEDQDEALSEAFSAKFKELLHPRDRAGEFRGKGGIAPSHEQAAALPEMPNIPEPERLASMSEPEVAQHLVRAMAYDHALRMRRDAGDKSVKAGHLRDSGDLLRHTRQVWEKKSRKPAPKEKVMSAAKTPRPTIFNSVLTEALGHESLDRSPKKNWVERSGQLPAAIQHMAKDIHEERGMPLDQAIPIAISQAKKLAAKGNQKYVTAVAEWEALKAKNAAKKLKEGELSEAKRAEKPKEPKVPVKEPSKHPQDAKGGDTGPGVESVGERVAHLQRRLTSLGFDAVPDGNFGGKTRAAVMEFQTHAMLKPDGLVGPQTSAALKSAPHPNEMLDADGNGVADAAAAVGSPGAPKDPSGKAIPAEGSKEEEAKESPSQEAAEDGKETLYKGMGVGEIRGHEGVRHLQADLGHLGHEVTTDGRFGPDTQRTLKSFQRTMGLKVDGICGPKTHRTIAGRKAKKHGLEEGFLRRGERHVELKRLPDGTFAPKGRGQLLKGGDRVKLPDGRHARLYPGIPENTSSVGPENMTVETDAPDHAERKVLDRLARGPMWVDDLLDDGAHPGALDSLRKSGQIVKYPGENNPDMTWYRLASMRDRAAGGDAERVPVQQIRDTLSSAPTTQRVKVGLKLGDGTTVVEGNPDGHFDDEGVSVNNQWLRWDHIKWLEKPKGVSRHAEYARMAKEGTPEEKARREKWAKEKAGRALTDGTKPISGAPTKVAAKDVEVGKHYTVTPHGGTTFKVTKVEHEGPGTIKLHTPDLPKGYKKYDPDEELGVGQAANVRSRTEPPKEWIDEPFLKSSAHMLRHPVSSARYLFQEAIEEAKTDPLGALVSKLVAAGIPEEQAKSVAQKNMAKAGGKSIELHRLPNGQFAPKGQGVVLKAGDKVSVPHKDGKGQMLSGSVKQSGPGKAPYVTLDSGPDAGKPFLVKSKAGDAKPEAKSTDAKPNPKDTAPGASDVPLPKGQPVKAKSPGEGTPVKAPSPSEGKPVKAPTAKKVEAPKAQAAGGWKHTEMGPNSDNLSLKDMPLGATFQTNDGKEYTLHKTVGDPWVITKPTDGGKAKPMHKMSAPSKVGPIADGYDGALPASDPGAAAADAPAADSSSLFDALAASVDVAKKAKEQGKDPAEALHAAKPAPAAAPKETPESAALKLYKAQGGKDPAVIAALTPKPKPEAKPKSKKVTAIDPKTGLVNPEYLRKSQSDGV